MRMLHGNPPPNTPPVASLDHEPDATRWLLFPLEQSDGWLGYKLVADGAAERKANYWFSLSSQGRWFGRSRDLKLLKDHRPALYTTLLRHFGLEEQSASKPEATAPEPEPDDVETFVAGTLRGLWDVVVQPDPLGWDEVTLEPTDAGGTRWVLHWNGSAFRQSDDWLSFSAKYQRAVDPLEKMLSEAV